MEKKESRTGAIIGAVAAILLCGLTGLCLLLPFGIATFANAWTFTDYNIPSGWGFLFLCLAVVFIIIGIVVPILLLRKKKAPKAEGVIPPSEPLPPAS